MIRLHLIARVTFWHRQPSFTGQNLDRLHKADVFRFTNKRNRVAFGVAPKAVVIALAVIDVKRRALFLMKRTRRPHVALAWVGLLIVPHHFAANHLGQRQACAQFIQKTRGQTHKANIGAGPAQVQRSDEEGWG